ncbi:hypothetical protein [Aminobacter sp. AP02]|uniref:hypothetical protein n=1 Tax=Aminobacter sp. AP02 TaxID=2135737 RepID=UPI000D6BFB93|nr:hypothetical protein [Aminobacter sp. AP02]PWK76330.1 hypothetical protein C8K44_102319 [Aminobacter sp. AP02]
MVPFDRGTRDLLPLFDAGPREIIGAVSEAGGGPAHADKFPSSSATSNVHRPADPPAATNDGGGAHGTMPVKGSSLPAAASHGLDASGKEAGGLHLITISLPRDLHPPKLAGPLHSEPGRIDAHHEATQGDKPAPGTDVDDAANPELGEQGSASEDGHSIRVTQFAEVDQDASIIVEGYVGEVVARLHIDQDLMMDQDVDISFTIDGEGRFAILVDQDMRIDQDTQIDVDFHDDKGVLYVDVFLHDSITVEQETAVDMLISDGGAGGTVDVQQDIELDQDVNIDIDIEDELEERYVITLDVEVVQDVDAAQDADVDITDRNGEIEMDVDAIQTASVDQEIIVRADFALA